MASYNKVVLMGNVTRIPDVRNLPGSATTVATTGLAVSRKYKEKEEVMFIDIVAYGKQAETIGMYITKGSPLLVEGRLSFRQWEQEGQKRSKHEVIVESFQMLGGRKDRAEFDESMVDKDDLKLGSDDVSADKGMIGEDDVPF